MKQHYKRTMSTFIVLPLSQGPSRKLQQKALLRALIPRHTESPFTASHHPRTESKNPTGPPKGHPKKALSRPNPTQHQDPQDHKS